MILVFASRTASHLHHCRHHSFLNLQHRLVIWCRGNIAQKTTEREVAAGTGTTHVADVQSEMDFRCSALDCDDRLTHSQGGGTNAPRLQAEFPHVNRMVSLTNASVIPSLLFAVVLDFRSWKTSSGDLSVITATIKLTSCHVACGRRWASPCARSTRSVQSCHEPICKASFGEWYSLLEHDSSSHNDFERGRRREMSSLPNEREQSLPRETAPQPTKHVHLRSVACHRGWFLTAPFCF